MKKLVYQFLIIFLILPTPAEQKLPAGHAARMKAGTELFQKTIRPALVENCLKCHGDEKVRSGLDLSSRELLLEGGDSGDTIDLADPGNSFLLAVIRHDEEPEMPPKKDKLADPLIADFQKWIALGAPFDKPLIEKEEDQPVEMQVTDNDRDFWSFRPLANPTPPHNGEQMGKNRDRSICALQVK